MLMHENNSRAANQKQTQDRENRKKEKACASSREAKSCQRGGGQRVALWVFLFFFGPQKSPFPSPSPVTSQISQFLLRQLNPFLSSKKKQQTSESVSHKAGSDYTDVCKYFMSCHCYISSLHLSRSSFNFGVTGGDFPVCDLHFS